MAAAWPGAALRPHVKAFKSTALARRLADAGHHGFCCATIREMEGMAAAGLGDDLLLANEVLDARRLGVLGEAGARITVAVDSAETIAAAAAGGVREVLIDVCVGLPRCGCPPDEAGRLADAARGAGLEVRGVMGYEGHVVGLEDRADREAKVAVAMEILLAAHEDVGGDVISGGGTGTWDSNRWVTELQAGSYLLMDTAYAKLGHALRPRAQRARAPSCRSTGPGAGPWPTSASSRSAWTTVSRRWPSPRAPRCGSAPTSTSRSPSGARPNRRGSATGSG